MPMPVHFRRALLTPLLAAGLAGPLAAADAPLDPSQFLPPAAVATLRLNDLPRSQTRFVGTPFAKLLATGWGKLLSGHLDGGLQDLAKQGNDVVPILRSLTAATVGIALPAKDQQDIAGALLLAGDAAPLKAMLTKVVGAEPTLAAGNPTWVVGGGQLTAFGQLFAYASAPAGGGLVKAVTPRSPVTPAVHPEACLEGLIDVKAFAEFLRTTGTPNSLSVGSGMIDSVAFSLALDPIGIREHWDMPFAAAHAAALAPLVAPPANLDLLRSLPATTLFALTVHVDAKQSAQELAIAKADIDDAQLGKIDGVLGQAGLPPYLELVKAIDGDVLVFCEEGVPFPTGTLALGLAAETATKLLAALKDKASLQDLGDGTLSGMVGVVQLQAAYQKGQLILTTNPAGIAGFAARQAGFADQPEIKSALAELKPGAVGVGVSRTGATYAAFAQLALTFAAMAGVDPKYMTMPQDLRAAGRYGFLSYQRTPKGYTLDAGGLLGGVIGMYSLLGGAAAGAYFYTFAQMNGLQAAPAQPPAGKPAKDPEQVF